MDAYLHLNLLKRQPRALALKRIIQERIKPGMRVLDAGCGSGILSVWAGLQGAEVVGVDLASTTLAEALVAENGLQGRVRIIQGDLFSVNLPDGHFDALLAMVYLNDPRRDEDRPGLVHRLKRFLQPGALLVPDAVRYTLRPAQWPAQAIERCWQALDREVAELEAAYGIGLQSLARALRERPNKALFPARGPDGLLAAEGAVMLGPAVTVQEVRLAEPPPTLPARVSLRTNADGVAHAGIWEQELLFGETVIFRNQSVGWVVPPAPVRAGGSIAFELGDAWRRDNLLRPC